VRRLAGGPRPWGATPKPVAYRTIVRQWGRIGCTGFGGPPTHIAMLRTLCVDQEGWLHDTEFEDAVAVTNLLPGPASTQLAILCAWRLRGWQGALLGGASFISLVLDSLSSWPHCF
jgi:chromate transporter